MTGIAVRQRFTDIYGQVRFSRNLYRKYDVQEFMCEISECPNVPQDIVAFDGTVQTWKPRVVIDHCHMHGWVRGIICRTCNGIMRNIDLGITNAHRYRVMSVRGSVSISAIDYMEADNRDLYLPEIDFYSREICVLAANVHLDYRLNCPDCI